MKLRHIVSLLLCALLVFQPVIPAMASNAGTGGFIENVISLPSGYDNFTAPAVKPDGSVIVAAGRSDADTWDLLTWQDITQAPTVTPLAVEGGELTYIDVAPDGWIMGVINPLFAVSGEVAGTEMSADGKIEGETAAEDVAANEADGENSDDAEAEEPVFTTSGSFTGGGGMIAGGAISDMISTVYWFNDDGSVSTQFEVQGILMNVKAASGQRLVASGGMQSGIEIYDSTGKSINNLSARSVRSLCVTDTSLLYIDAMEAGKLYELDLETGDIIRTVALSATNSAQIAGGHDGIVYVVDSLGVQRIGAGETESTNIMENPTDYLIGNPDNGFSGVCVLADGSLVMKIDEGGGNAGFGSAGGTTVMRIGGPQGDIENTKLVSYTYKADLDLSNRTPFTISALQGNSMLRKAVSEFQRLHPELIVSLQTLIPDDDTETPLEDAIRTLNTDLLAGKGGDVLMLDKMPVNKYIEKGVLMDLTDALSGIGFIEGIYEGSKSSDGKLYAIPTFFSAQTIWGNENYLTGVESLQDLVNVSIDPGQTIMNPRTPEDWLRMFFPASESAFRDDAGNLQFNTPEFEMFLESLYTLYSTQGVMQESTTGVASRLSMEDMQALINGAVALFPTNINGTMQLPLAYTVTGKEESAFIPVPSVNGSGTSFTPSMLAGINAQSQNKELATEFIRSLYSPDMQQVQQINGMPVVAASLDALVEEGKERARESESGNIRTSMVMAFGSGTPLEIDQPNEETWDDVRNLINALDTSTTIDDVLMGFIVEETASFFEGYKSAAEAADAVQQRAWSYLNE